MEDLEELQEFFRKWGSHILVAIVGVFAIGYIVFSYRESQVEALKRASDGFFQTQTAYEEFAETELKMLNKKIAYDNAKRNSTLKDEEVKKIKEEYDAKLKEYNDKLKILRGKLKSLLKEKEPYSSFGRLYTEIVSMREDLAGLKTKVGEGKAFPHMFLEELYSFITARELLDNKGKEQEGWDRLVTLARDGRYIQTASAYVLAVVADSMDRVREALKIARYVANKFPEQESFLSHEIKRLEKMTTGNKGGGAP